MEYEALLIRDEVGRKQLKSLTGNPSACTEIRFPARVKKIRVTDLDSISTFFLYAYPSRACLYVAVFSQKLWHLLSQ